MLGMNDHGSELRSCNRVPSSHFEYRKVDDDVELHVRTTLYVTYENENQHFNTPIEDVPS